MSGFRLSQDEELALIRAHLHNGTIDERDSSTLMEYGLATYALALVDRCELTFAGHLLAQALIEKKLAQARILRDTAKRIVLLEIRFGGNAFRARELIRHWASKFEREARGE